MNEIPLACIRLECSECDEQHDGITPEELAQLGWSDVREIQSYEEACRTYDDPADEPPGYSVLDWQTHIGLCPECAKEHS